MDVQFVDLVSKFIGSVGFPIAVAAWLLVRIDPLLRDITAAVVKLTERLESMERR